MDGLLLSCKKLLKNGPAAEWDGCEVARLYQYVECYKRERFYISLVRELNMLSAPIKVTGYFEAFGHLLNFSDFDETEIRLILHYEIEYRCVEACPYVVSSWTHTNESLQDLSEIIKTHLNQARKNFARMQKSATKEINGKICIPSVYKDLSSFVNR